MSTELKTIKTKAGDLTLTQFHGGKDCGLCVQLTAPTLDNSIQPINSNIIQLTQAEALELGLSLLEWVHGHMKTDAVNILDPGWDKEAV